MPVANSTKWLAAALSPDALITFVSAASEPLTGYRPYELLGQPAIELLENNSALELPRILAEADESGRWEGDVVFRTRSGEQRPAYGIVSPMAGTETTGYMFVSALTDAQKQEESKQSTLDGIAGVLRGYAHDMNNSLAIIMGFTQLLMINEACPENAKNDLGKIFEELQKLIDLVERTHRYAYSLYKNPAATR